MRFPIRIKSMGIRNPAYSVICIKLFNRFFPMQPVADDNHSSSGEEVEAVGEDEQDEEEEDEDVLVNNSSEQLDHIRFEDGQLIDGYNFR